MTQDALSRLLRARQERFAEIALPHWLQILGKRYGEPGYDDKAMAVEAARLAANTDQPKA